mmetsp:Transcript_14116/g.27867  ORF Transcript_14116/g.27867 Transcript_14116/m.27867 type:complete len:205 (-) Transcript_14116:16-630(-)
MPATAKFLGNTHGASTELKQQQELIQRRLLHDADELLLAHLAVTITISLIDHLLELLIRHVLAKLLGHALQVLERDLPGLVVVEEAEGLDDLLHRVALGHLGRHHLEELVEVDGARPVRVDVRNHLLDLLLLGLEAEGAHGNLELLGIDGTRPVSVEEVEGLADLLLLLLSQGELVSLLLLPAARGGAAVVGHFSLLLFKLPPR